MSARLFLDAFKRSCKFIVINLRIFDKIVVFLAILQKLLNFCLLTEVLLLMIIAWGLMRYEQFQENTTSY